MEYNRVGCVLCLFVVVVVVALEPWSSRYKQLQLMGIKSTCLVHAAQFGGWAWDRTD